MRNIELGAYVAEIKAKRFGEKRSTEESTSFLLNEISLVYKYAALYMESKGYDHLADDYNEKGNYLYHLLTDLGFYGD